ncbi:MAG: hypothetical protein NXI31_11130 [bacterium]|nr:hypothetical protein [bacterium]
MADPDTQSSSTLPLWVAVACCVAATFLVFGNTLPALEERRELDHVETDLATLHRRYAEAIQLARLAGARGDSAPELDLQSLFVAIDQKGYTVAEFCAAHASKGDAEPATAGPTGR